MRYVIRPDYIRRTPFVLAGGLGLQTRRWPGRIAPDWRRDFFMVYPAHGEVANGGDQYRELSDFYSRHKAGQRQQIAAMGIPAQPVILREEEMQDGITYVVRPWRHHGGHSYHIRQRAGTQLRGEWYASPVFPKTREYRIVFVYGRPVLLYKKRKPENATPDRCWTGDNTYFITIPRAEWGDTALCAHTDVLDRLLNCRIIQTSHIVGVDIMYSGKSSPRYSVLEFNTCPGLQLEGSIDAVIAAIQLGPRPL